MLVRICLVAAFGRVPCDFCVFPTRSTRKGLATYVEPMIPVLSLRMVQLQLCAMYWYSGWQKFNSKTWQKGSALYYSLSTGNYMRSESIVDPMLDTQLGHDFLEILTYTTMYWEFSFPLLMLWRPTRWLGLLIGLGMHAGIHITLMVAFFSAASVWGYLAFLPYDWVERLEARWARWRHGPVEAEE